LTAEDVTDAISILSGGTSTGSATSVKYMFYYGAASAASGDDIFFYIPNKNSYSISYATDGTTKLKTYRAIVNGVVNSALVVLESKSVSSKFLYKITKYESDGKTLKDFDVVTDLNNTAGQNLEDFDKSFAQVAGETYILTSSTVYINVTAGTGFEIVNYDFLVKNYKVYVNYDPDTYEALQVYITKVPTLS
jgi:hypothetical protein